MKYFSRLVVVLSFPVAQDLSVMDLGLRYPGARGFFLVGGDRIERRSRDGESRSGEKKTSGTNG